MTQPNYLQEVREQYENYPYPVTDPQLEKKRLHVTFCEALDRLNHYCFSGKKNFTKGFRALAAGDGTGNATIALAEQLRDTDAEIIYLDMTKASMEIAQERARIRGLTNITWIHDSILNIPQLGLGQFDYINCAGVLHHLSDPDAGLRILADATKDDGALGIMLYATYGRLAVYQMQDALRLLNENEPNMQTRVDNAKSMLTNLPTPNWFFQSPPEITQEIRNDIGIYDLLLHSQDRAYTVPQIYDYAAQTGLKVVQMISGHPSLGNHAYNPASYLKDPALIARAASLPASQQQALAELLNGKITHHTFYAAKTIAPMPDPADLDNIPLIGFNLAGAEESIANIMRDSADIVAIEQKAINVTVRFPKTPHMEAIFRRIDGKASLREIFRKVMDAPAAKKTSPDFPKLTREFAAMLDAMFPYHWLYLRGKGSAPVRYPDEMNARVRSMYPGE